MSANKPAERDERSVAVENASYSLGYRVIAFALLLDVAIRAWKLGDPGWDLMAIVIGSGVLVTVYQWWNRVLTRRCVKLGLVTVVLGAIVAALVAAARYWL